MSTASPPTTVPPYVGRGPGGLIIEDEARELLEELAASGLTAVAFCLGKGLHSQRLSWWKSRLARRSSAREGRSPTAPRIGARGLR